MALFHSQTRRHMIKSFLLILQLKNYAVGILGTHSVNYVEKFRNMPNFNENLNKPKEKVPFIAISLSALANWILFVCVDAIYVPVNNFSHIRTFPGLNLISTELAEEKVSFSRSFSVSIMNQRDQVKNCVSKTLTIWPFINGIAKTLKKLRTSKGDYSIKQWFSLIAPVFKMGTSLKGKNLLPEGVNSFLLRQGFCTPLPSQRSPTPTQRGTKMFCNCSITFS